VLFRSTEDTLGNWHGTSPDWFFNYYW